jgi:hypothetical protein
MRICMNTDFFPENLCVISSYLDCSEYSCKGTLDYKPSKSNFMRPLLIIEHRSMYIERKFRFSEVELSVLLLQEVSIRKHVNEK